MDTVKIRNKIILFISLLFVMFNFNVVHADSEVILTFSDSSIKETVSGSGYNITGTTLEITKAGTYRIKGSCSEGNIEVKKGVTGVTLILDNLTLTSEKTAPIVIKKDGASATIKLVGTNNITSNEDPANEFSSDPDVADAYEGAAIKVKNGSSVTFEGTGVLNAESTTNNGIKGGSESNITINSGVINIGAANHGLACDGTITINNGFLTIDAHNEGIKLEPDEGDDTSLAKLTINGGKVVVDAGEDGIQAMGDIEINGWSIVEVNSMFDGIQTRSNFTMTNGTVNIHTYEGYNTLDFDSDVLSAKGIKAAKTDEAEENATNNITITGGTITIDSSDDAIHSDGNITITRGTINVQSGDDGIHADTTLTIGTQNGLERDPEINVNDAIEGIEAGNIYVYSGKIKVIALDDGINAAGGASTGSAKEHGEHFNPATGQMEDNYALYVYGGTIFVNCEGDGLDANGSLYLYGGTQIIYHQDAQGNNSALDRDARLVIDGATVFSAGGVADNGHVDTTGSTQKIIIDETTDYAANSKVAVKDGGNVVFNDQIPKRSTYTFYSSPSLTDDAEITTVTDLVDEFKNPFDHSWDSGVITTPATETSTGVITYGCSEDDDKERKTYFYKGEVELNVINKTNKQVSVKIASTTSDEDFTTTDIDEFIYITTPEDVEIITTYDGTNYEPLSGDPTANTNEYKYHIDPTMSQTIYVILDGDVNMDGNSNYDDSVLIARSLISTSDSRYYELSNLQKILADVNDDGLINSHDGLANLKELPGDDVYDESYFGITSIEPVILDGEHDGEATISFLTKKAIVIDAMDGRYSPSQENPSTNGYLELTDIDGAKEGDVEFALIDVVNGFAGAVDTNGLSIPADTVLVTLKYKVDKDTPTGTYPVKLRIDSVTAHDSHLDSTFELTADVIVKGTTDPLTAFFSKDEGVASIDTYYTQNYNTPSETNVSSAVVRNSDTGEIDQSGDGQVNFTVNLKEGYIISDITVTPSNGYKNIKGPADTGVTGTYRITKISSDIEIIITTKKATEYTATFIKDKHIDSIDIYYTQDYTNPDELDVEEAYARDSDTGALLINGDGQINFRVNPKPGYKVEDVSVSGNYKNLKEQEDRIYRVTKINGDLIITITSAEREAITPEVTGIENSYTYTGKKIKPEPVVTISGTETTLVKGTDYSVTYGSNKNVGTNAGTVTITSLDSSDYSFDPITINFDITPYEIKENNISAPASIVYTGSTLTPTVEVNANGTTLVEGTDYDLELINADGNIDEQITVKVTGKGNYTGVVDTVKINITAKANQIISFDTTEITKVYGDDFVKTATLSVGDGEITYTSNNTQAAIVDAHTGAVTLVGTGQATIRAFASETDNYAEAVTSYKVIVKKAPLTIDNVTISDKSYDGTKTATVTNIVFGGLVKDEVLEEGTDYTFTAEFDNKEVGNNKDVTVKITLSTEVIKRYSLEQDTYIGQANITNGVITEPGIILSNDTYVYNGTPKKPDVTVMVGDKVLVKDADYKLEYVDNVEAGTAKVVVTGIGNYASDPIEKTFTINKKNITPTIEDIDDVTYTGSEIKPTLKVTYKDKTLVEGKDYTVEYTNNTDAGTANVKISPVSTSGYVFDDTTSDASKTFTIKPFEITEDNIKLEYNIVKYDGTAKEPSVTVTVNNNTLVKDTDYSLTYNDNTNIGTDAKVTVTAISNNYTGHPSVKFEISDKNGLTISGVEKQQVTFTGNEVQLEGNLTVSENTDGITPNDITENYYDSEGNEISKPTNAGKYKVVYSYEGPNYKGKLEVEFEITKAESTTPSEVSANLEGTKGDKLSTLDLETNGLAWEDENTKIKNGTNNYPATYTQNNDSDNYTTIKVNIPVTGKVKVNINTSVQGTGGTITESIQNVYQGTTKNITVTPDEGYEIDYVTVNNEDIEVTNNTFSVTAGTKDMNIVVAFKTIEYKLNISGKNTETGESGIVKVDYNSDRSVTITPEYGYKLTSVKVNGEEKLDNLSGNTLTINNITEDTNVEILSEKIIYEVVEGARQIYVISKNDKARFKINAEYNLFETGGEVYVDEKLVDSSNYTSEEGSTVITFKKSFMDNLSVGAHSLHVKFNDGGMASTIFKVAKVSKVAKYEGKKDDDGTNNIINPITGDNIMYIVLVLLVSILTILSIKAYKTKRS